MLLRLSVIAPLGSVQQREHPFPLRRFCLSSVRMLLLLVYISHGKSTYILERRKGEKEWVSVCDDRLVSIVL